jgi:ubiquinone/menaquinone biosynthesis C-methylase UbiE
MQKFLSEIPDGSTVLDVPFGTGRFIEFYLKKNMSVYGIDISKDMLDIAREHLGDHYNQCNISVGSAEHLPFENDFFDLLVSCRFLTLIPMAMVKKVLS